MMQQKVFIFLILLFNINFTSGRADWSLGAGFGPNFSQFDAVNDSLKSSAGATLWAENNINNETRFDISYNYFSFTGSASYQGLSGAYGWLFNQSNPNGVQPAFLIGAGLGKANNIPLALNNDQTTPHLFARVGFDNLWKSNRISLSLMMDAVAVKLDGKNVESAYFALPILALKFNLDGIQKTSATEYKSADIKPKPVVEKIVRTELDSDQDGVFDKYDECPNTSFGIRVNSIGCPPKKIVKKTLRVEFKTGKAQILPSYYSSVDEFAKYLKTYTDLNVIIEGHTDNVGKRSYNIKLSKARADSVLQYLVAKHGISKSRLKAVGYGPDRPEVENINKKNKQINRRVIAIFSSN